MLTILRVVAVTFDAMEMCLVVVIEFFPSLGRRAAEVDGERAFRWASSCPRVSRIPDSRNEDHQDFLRPIDKLEVVFDDYAVITSISSRTRNRMSARLEDILPCRDGFIFS